MAATGGLGSAVERQVGRPFDMAQQGAPRAAELDQLFALLRESQDAAQLAMAEARIRQLWLEAASPAARLLLQRGTRHLNARLPEEAIEDFDAALTLAPDASGAATIAFARALSRAARWGGGAQAPQGRSGR